ncbi:MAG TPA: macro domain-containing protein [Anaerovoracaceae bacterium]|nr:macro domain-containing protein [Anaerovoracaceae bacterium]
MPLEIIRNDITKMKVDAIVNASNISLKKGGGVSGAIFTAAGENELQQECDKIGKCGVGEAVVTKGFQLPAKYIIHTVGPIWQGGNHNEEKLLKNCYTNSLILAYQNKCKSIAFPLISSGVYGYPKDKAFNIAVTAISDFLMNQEMAVYLVVYDKSAIAIGEKLFANIEKYIDDNYVDSHSFSENRRMLADYEVTQPFSLMETTTYMKPRKLEDIIWNLDETFSQMLLRLIDEKGFTDVQAYKKANIDRKLFSKIRSNKDYNPKKTTVLAFAMALELNLDETLDLLGKAGYTLSSSNKFDVIIQFFIEEGKYDIYTINQTLFYYDQMLLGA